MDPTDCLAYLDSACFGVLGTVDPDHGPHLVPVVFAVADGELVVPIDSVKPKETKRLRRIENLRADPRASLLVDHRSDDWTELWWVRVDLDFKGTVEVGTAWQSRLAARYSQYRQPGTIHSLLLFDVRSLRGWTATHGREPLPHDEDAFTTLLGEHIDAWNAHDLDRLIDLFADDCVFDASGGTKVLGERYEGKPAVREAFGAVFDGMPDAHWGNGRHYTLDADHCVSQWTLTGTLADGSRVEVDGCDFLTIRDGLIVRKNSFRKQRPPIRSSQ